MNPRWVCLPKTYGPTGGSSPVVPPPSPPFHPPWTRLPSSCNIIETLALHLVTPALVEQSGVNYGAEDQRTRATNHKAPSLGSRRIFAPQTLPRLLTSVKPFMGYLAYRLLGFLAVLRRSYREVTSCCQQTSNVTIWPHIVIRS